MVRGRRMLIAFIIIIICITLLLGWLRRSEISASAQDGVLFTDGAFSLTGERDALVVFGQSTIALEQNSRVTGDVSLIAVSGSPVRVDGRIEGDLTVFGGPVSIGEYAVVRGATTVISDKVDLQGRLEGDVLLQSSETTIGAQADLRSTVSVCGQRISEVTDMRSSPMPLSTCIGWGSVNPGPLLLLIVGSLATLMFSGLSVLAVTIFPQQVSQMEDAIRHRPRRLAGVGLAALALVIGLAAAVVLLLAAGPFIGAVLTPIYLVFVLSVFAACLAGAVTLAQMLGDALMRRLGLHGPPVITAFVGAVLLALPLTLLLLVPWVGLIALLVIVALVIVALGAALDTCLGTRTARQRYFVQG